MAKPPMPDKIKLHVIKYGADGLPLENRYGVEEREAVDTNARVKYTNAQVFTTSGDETTAVLELSLPPDQAVRAGDIVEWVDRFGVTVKEPILSLKEVLSYNGKVVYYRKAWAGAKG